MKNKILIILFLLLASSTLSAQVDSKNLGLRLGWSIEASYQHPLGASNRLEADLGLDFSGGVNAAAVYQWVWDLSALSPGFNWYAGAGAAIGIWDDNFALGGLGNIGIEYNFNVALDVPLQLSLDWRPGLYFVSGKGNGFHFGAESICLGIRYKF